LKLGLRLGAGGVFTSGLDAAAHVMTKTFHNSVNQLQNWIMHRPNIDTG
jgi:hypothetical protein